MARELRRRGVTHVVMEASGVYTEPVYYALCEQDFTEVAVIAFFFAAGFFCPPKRRTSRLYRACSRPRTRIADQAAWMSIGLM